MQEPSDAKWRAVRPSSKLSGEYATARAAWGRVSAYLPNVLVDPPAVAGWILSARDVAAQQSIDALQIDGMNSQDICLVARTTSLVDSYAAALKRLGIPIKVISRRQPDHRSTSGVRLATMHRVKGLEFRAVFMVGLNKGVVPLDGFVRTKDPVEAELRSANERALFHVAATRAVRRLFLSSFGEASLYLDR